MIGIESIANIFKIDIALRGEISEILRTAGAEIRKWNEANKGAKSNIRLEKQLDRYLTAAFSRRTYIGIDDVRKAFPNLTDETINSSLSRIGGMAIQVNSEARFYYPIEKLSKRYRRAVEYSVSEAITSWLNKEGMLYFEDARKRFPQITNDLTLREMIIRAGGLRDYDSGAEEVYLHPAKDLLIAEIETSLKDKENTPSEDKLRTIGELDLKEIESESGSNTQSRKLSGVFFSALLGTLFMFISLIFLSSMDSDIGLVVYILQHPSDFIDYLYGRPFSEKAVAILATAFAGLSIVCWSLFFIRAVLHRRKLVFPFALMIIFGIFPTFLLVFAHNLEPVLSLSFVAVPRFLCIAMAAVFGLILSTRLLLRQLR